MRPVKPPNPNPHPPRYKLPAGACDCHLHVYGPFERYPLIAERGYDPDPHSTLDDYLQTHRALGLERAVIVTGSGNGTNNRITLDALKRMNGTFKGLALLDPAVTDAELVELKDGGFSGFRIKANGRGGLSFDDTKRMIARTRGIQLARRVHVAIAGGGDRRRAVFRFTQSPIHVRPCRPRRAAHDRRE